VHIAGWSPRVRLSLQPARHPCCLTQAMPRFNIFKAFTSTVKPNQSKESKAATSGQLQQDDTTNTRPPARKLTKRKPGASPIEPIEPIEPSYSVRREDIGYADLGRYPSQLPEPIVGPLCAYGVSILIIFCPARRLIEPTALRRYPTSSLSRGGA
jgi:hypothetical protein